MIFIQGSEVKARIVGKGLTDIDMVDALINRQDIQEKHSKDFIKLRRQVEDIKHKPGKTLTEKRELLLGQRHLTGWTQRIKGKLALKNGEKDELTKMIDK